ncbi:Glu/Leu/Phe/Val dehydrogenase dimerization domain-containing protein [Mesorhizobium sp.]|uniref:Glu/Leu/Phe/Val family dehydrogenase n=1 Tax=Mesorhizobium sp. TaxID=1871066 RepID=UPI00338FCA02
MACDRGDPQHTAWPAAGGCRIYPYKTDAEAIADALRLSKGMSYKNALAGLPLGGGKAVIIADPQTEKTPALMRAFGRVVETYSGRYITAEDVGCVASDMDTVATETRHVAGLSARVGDPSPYTARGVFMCMRLAARERLGRDLAGLKVAVKGVGHVGLELCRLLAAAGTSLVVADVRAENARRAAELFGADVVATEEIASLDVDIFAPCALGGDINAAASDRLRARIVCGGANNQLLTAGDDRLLLARNITYCPDYLVNAGGIVAIAGEVLSYDDEDVRCRIEAFPDVLREVLHRSEKERRPTGEIADDMAQAILYRPPRIDRSLPTPFDLPPSS